MAKKKASVGSPLQSPAWFMAAMTQGSSAKVALPKWLNPAALPSLTADGERLGADHVTEIVRALAAPPVTVEVKERGLPTNRLADRGPLVAALR